MEHTEKSGSYTSPGPDVFASQWRQMRGTLRSWWGKLNDNDWEQIAGEKDKLLGVLQEKYGYTRDRARHEMEQRFDEYLKQSGASKSGSMAEQPGYSTNVTSPGAAFEHAAPQTQHSGSQQMMNDKIQASAQNLKGQATEGIAKAKETVGKKMSAFADTLRHNAGQQGSMQSTTHAVANRLATAGSYLEAHTFEDMTADMTSLIRRYPIQSLLLGVGIGFFISRGMER